MTWNRILIGDCRATLAEVPERSIHCAVCSPPYWGLRSYLPKDHPNKAVEIGNEPTPEAFIETMLDVFRAVRRVLRDDGTLWVNLGDTYAGSFGAQSKREGEGIAAVDVDRFDTVSKTRNASAIGYKPGDLCNMPHRVAAALQNDGWYWRSTIVWAKRSPMPESVSGWRWRRCKQKTGRAPVDWSKTPKGWDVGQGSHDAVPNGNYRQNGEREQTVAVYEPCPGCDKCRANGGYVLRKGRWRPTTGHEYIFMFSKSDSYFCDGDAVQEVAVGGTPGNKRHKGADAYANGDGHMRTKVGLVNMVAAEARNPRTVWTLSSEPYKGAHFATFPTEIPRRCISAGTSPQCCGACGSPCAPVVESERVATRPGVDTKCYETGGYTPESPYRDHAEIGNRDPQRHVAVSRVTGYRPTCGCNAEPAPCRVLDPFLGSGTTAQVAEFLGRDWIGCELSESYAELARARIATPPRFRKAKSNGKPVAMKGQQSLFASLESAP